MAMYAVQDKANIGHVCGEKSILTSLARSTMRGGRVAALLDVSEARHTIQSRLSSSLLSVRNAALAAALGLTLVTGTLPKSR